MRITRATIKGFVNRVDELQVKTFLRRLPRRLPMWADVNRRVVELLAKYPDDPRAQKRQSPDHPLYIQALVGVLNDNGCPADFDTVQSNINEYIRGIQELRADVKTGRIASAINERPVTKGKNKKQYTRTPTVRRIS